MKFINQKENGNPKQIGTYNVDCATYIILTEEILKISDDNKLSKTEALIYALIDNMCNNSESHVFYGTGNYIASRVHCNIPYALKGLKKLESKGLILKLSKSTKGIPNQYTIPKFKHVQQINMPWEIDI